jgi:hypothetical protein
MSSEIEVALRVVAVIGVVAVLAAVVAYVRRWMFSNEDAPISPGGFTLSDLRQLHRDGKMSDEEFERAKARLVAVAQRSMTPPPEPKSKPQAEPKDPMNPPAVE